MSPFPSDLTHFTADEFSAPDAMDHAFLRWLDRVRAVAGVPFVITDDARLPHEHPTGAADRSLHQQGRAVDLRTRDWTSAQKWRVIAAIVTLAGEAPGAIEWSPIYAPGDRHWHLGIDVRTGAVHEMIEADE